MMKTARFVGLTLVLSLSGLMSGSGLEAAGTGSTGVAAESDIAAKAPLKAAIFVRNRGGKAMDSKIDLFSDQLSARLSEKGFAVMDWKDVVQKFRESNESDDRIFSNVRTVMAIGTDTGVTGSSIATTERTSGAQLETSVGGQGDSGGIARASLLRVAQMLDADYIIVASIGKVGKESRTFKGEGTMYQTNNTADIYSLPMTVKVLAGSSGQSIYGDTVTASDRILQNASITISVDNMPDRLIDSGALKLATNISDKVQRIRDTALKGVTKVPFTIECNVVGATVELDGAAIGSPPASFSAAPGIHQLTVSRQYFITWERSVNIVANQKITVSLEFTTEGLAKYKDITAFNQAEDLQKLETVAKVDIAREQSKADADVKEKVSSGTKTFLENSYIRSEHFQEGLTTLVRGGDDAIIPIIPVGAAPKR
jgi:hypothetical protein